MSEQEQQNTEGHKPDKRVLTQQQERTAVIATASGLAVLAIVFVALLIAQPAWWKQLTKHNKPSYGYTLTAPQGWARMQQPPQGASVAFASSVSETDTTGKLAPFIVVQTTPLSSTAAKLTFQQLASDYVTGLEQNYQEYKQIATDSTTIERTPALFMTFTFTQNYAQITSDTLFMVDHGVIYDINGETLSSTWPQHSKEIQDSLLSFRP